MLLAQKYIKRGSSQATKIKGGTYVMASSVYLELVNN